VHNDSRTLPDSAGAVRPLSLRPCVVGDMALAVYGQRPSRAAGQAPRQRSLPSSARTRQPPMRVAIRAGLVGAWRCRFMSWP